MRLSEGAQSGRAPRPRGRPRVSRLNSLLRGPRPAPPIRQERNRGLQGSAPPAPNSPQSARCGSVADSAEMLVLGGMQEQREVAARLAQLLRSSCQLSAAGLRRERQWRPGARDGCLSDSLPPFAARCWSAYAAARPTPRRCRAAARSTPSAAISSAAGSGGSSSRTVRSTCCGPMW